MTAEEGDAPRFLSFATGWQRFVATIEQGHRRVRSYDRMVPTPQEQARALELKEAAQRDRAARERRAVARQAAASAQAFPEDMDTLVALYGDEVNRAPEDL